MKVAVHVIKAHGKAKLTCEAMAQGIRAVGDFAELRADTDHVEADCDAAVFWGYIETCQQIRKDYLAAGKPIVYMDMGYWQREGNAGYFKVSVNDRHPTKYFQRIRHNSARAAKFGINVRPWKIGGKHILLAGMSAKAAWAEKWEPAERFEKQAAAMLRRFTNRPIVYRPKPSWRDARPIEGTIFSSANQTLEEVLLTAHCVVTHHSNVGVDGLIAGIPVVTWAGVALPLTTDLYQIEYPNRPSGRDQWANDVAYCQWNVEEMKSGVVWRHLKDEGLV